MEETRPRGTKPWLLILRSLLLTAASLAQAGVTKLTTLLEPGTANETFSSDEYMELYKCAPTPPVLGPSGAARPRDRRALDCTSRALLQLLGRPFREAARRRALATAVPRA